MSTEVESLFHEVADFAFEARRRYYDEHQVAEDIRCQVEALVAFDSGSSGALMRDIEAVAGRALAEFEPQPCAGPGSLDLCPGPGSFGQSVEPALEASTEGLFAGQVVGAYRLRSPIGEGGMGFVWLAERVDGRFERHVAIKFLKIALGRQGQDRFLREGNILGRLAHPSVAQLLDAGVTA